MPFEVSSLSEEAVALHDVTRLQLNLLSRLPTILLVQIITPGIINDGKGSQFPQIGFYFFFHVQLTEYISYNVRDGLVVIVRDTFLYT